MIEIEGIVIKDAKPGWHITDNEKVVRGIAKGLKRNGGECPCKHSNPNPGSLKCQCDDYILRDCCCCGLYVKD